MIPVTRVWHIIDVGLGIAGVKEKHSFFSVTRLGFAIIGLAGNILIERSQVRKDVIELGGHHWKKLD